MRSSKTAGRQASGFHFVRVGRCIFIGVPAVLTVGLLLVAFLSESIEELQANIQHLASGAALAKDFQGLFAAASQPQVLLSRLLPFPHNSTSASQANITASALPQRPERPVDSLSLLPRAQQGNTTAPLVRTESTNTSAAKERALQVNNTEAPAALLSKASSLGQVHSQSNGSSESAAAEKLPGPVAFLLETPVEPKISNSSESRLALLNASESVTKSGACTSGSGCMVTTESVSWSLNTSTSRPHGLPQTPAEAAKGPTPGAARVSVGVSDDRVLDPTKAGQVSAEPAVPGQGTQSQTAAGTGAGPAAAAANQSRASGLAAGATAKPARAAAKTEVSGTARGAPGVSLREAAVPTVKGVGLGPATRAAAEASKEGKTGPRETGGPANKRGGEGKKKGGTEAAVSKSSKRAARRSPRKEGRKEVGLPFEFKPGLIQKPLRLDALALPCAASVCPDFSACSNMPASVSVATVKGRVTKPGRVTPSSWVEGCRREPEKLNVRWTVEGMKKILGSYCSDMVDTSASNETRVLLGTFFKLHNMYLGNRGVPFNESVYIDRNNSVGSVLNIRRASISNGTTLRTVPFLVNLRHIFGLNFYHLLVEVIPWLLTLGPMIPLNPSMSFFVTLDQYNALRNLGLPLVGEDMLPRLFIRPQNNVVIFAEELIQPYVTYCQSLVYIAELRRRFFLRPDGLPFFNLGWKPRHLKPLRHNAMKRLSQDWVVIQGIRLGRERSVRQRKEIHQTLLDLFGKERVVVFSGKGGILKVKELFNRAALFVAPHGALHANMIFMPLDSVVVELRPRGYSNKVFEALARVCGLRFLVLLGKGDKRSQLSVDMKEFKSTLKAALSRLKAPVSRAMRSF